MDGAGLRSANKLSSRAIAAWSLSAIDSRLSVRKRAREDAANDTPPPYAQDITATERDILRALEADHATLESARARAARETEQAMARNALAAQDFKGLVLEATLAIKQNAARAAPDIQSADARARRTTKDLSDFRARNRLMREPIYTDSALLQAGFLFLAALAEAMFSATLFAEDDARGLLGGAVTAVGLSGANIILGFLAGFVGLRYLQHRSAIMKSAGAAAFVAFGFLALLLNLFAADWRDRLATTGAAPSSDASFHLWSLLNLNTPQAIILLMLGAGVWVFATWKGYSSFDDPYPDYGKLARAAVHAQDELAEERGELLDDVETHLEALRKAVSARIETARASAAAASAAFDKGALEIAALDMRRRELDALGAAALQLYREENAAARTTPPPSYFADSPPAPAPPEDVLTGPAALMDATRKQLTEIEQAGAVALLEANAAFEATLAQITNRAPL